MAKTKSCKRCGEVIFKINPVCENSEAIGIVCNEKVYINCGEYSTYESKCKSCSNELFKLKRYDYGQKEIIKIECTNCKDEPNTYYVDKEGKQIDRSIREILLIKDRIERVENNVYNIENRIDDVETRIDYMEYDISTVNSKSRNNEESINNIEYDVDYIKRDISDIESSIRGLKDNIESLDNSIYNLETNN